jgi:beta-lactamase class A
MDVLERDIRRAIGGSGAGRVAVVAGPLGGARSVSIEPDAWFHAASTMKVAVLLELYRRAWAGAVSLDEPLVIRNEFRSIADGSPYVLRPADDSEFDLYERVGSAVSLRELAFRMITVSSNLATNLLVDRLGGGPAIQATLDSLGIAGVSVLRGVEDDVASGRGLNNTTTARGLADLLEAIALDRAAPPEACDAMLEVLAAQAFNEGIPAGLPPRTRVAHKTGSITSLYHDAAIAYPAAVDQFVLVVLTEGLDERDAAPALVGRIARRVHAGLSLHAGVEALMAQVDREGSWDDDRYDRLSEIVRLDPGAAMDLGEELLASAKAVRRETGAELLGVAGQFDPAPRERTVVRLRRVLAEDGEPGPLSSAIVHLGHLSDEPSRAAILAFAGRPEQEVRFAVAFAVPSVGLDDAAIDVLCRLSRDPDPEVRDWATFGIGQLTDADTPALRDALFDRVEDPDRDARAEGIIGLCRRQDGRVRPYLERELADPTHSEDIDEAAVFLADGSGRILWA